MIYFLALFYPSGIFSALFAEPIYSVPAFWLAFGFSFGAIRTSF